MVMDYVQALLNTFEKFLRGRSLDLIAIDIDGTLTISRNSFLLDLEVVDLLRRMRSLGVIVCLASANAYPVVKGLARYLGFEDAMIAENGCLIEVRGRLRSVATRSVRDAAEALKKAFGLVDSWQNPYRHYDYALLIPPSCSLNMDEVRDFIEKNFGDEVRVRFSGYAIHVYPPDCSKGRALTQLVRELGLRGCIVAIGDSEIDADMLEVADLGIAVGDADDELKKRADVVVPAPASRGTLLALEALYRYALISRRTPHHGSEGSGSSRDEPPSS